MILIANSIKDGLYEVAKNVYISKGDPDFLKKYLHYNPTDKEKLYEYAEKLMSEGQSVKAFEYFLKAAENGSSKAKRIIEEAAKINEEARLAELAAQNQVVRKKKKKLWPYYLLLLVFLIGLALLMTYTLGNMFTINKESTTNNYEYNNTTMNVAESYEATKEEELAFVVTRSAIEYYQDLTGEYPIGLWKLTKQSPNNYLTAVTKAIEYEKTDSGYKLSVEGIKTTDSMVVGLIKLVFYEQTNQLGVLKGNEVLALYDVASGKVEEPSIPVISKVTKRVVSPNGGDGALGTRGLQLTENYAIHGTNEPQLIGEKVSQGCLRMKNEEIEELYPYIPLGTPFNVEKQELPNVPTFKDGLPKLPGVDKGNSLTSETTPMEEYAWKK